MQKKMKLQQILIVVLAVVISILLVTLLAGRNDTTTIVVAMSDKIDTNKRVDEQLQYFQEKKILKSELEILGGKEHVVATSTKQLEGKYLRFKPAVGEPILASNLSSKKKAGEFAAEMTKYHTVFKITEGKIALPPQIQPGDKIDILSVIQPVNKNEGLTVGPVLTDVTIDSIVENDVYVQVKQSEAARLTLAQEIGKFVLQLPGQKKDSAQCSEVKGKDKEDVSCFTNDDKPSALSELDLRDYIRNNGVYENIKNTENQVENILELNPEQKEDAKKTDKENKN